MEEPLTALWEILKHNAHQELEEFERDFPKATGIPRAAKAFIRLGVPKDEMEYLKRHTQWSELHDRMMNHRVAVQMLRHR